MPAEQTAIAIQTQNKPPAQTDMPRRSLKVTGKIKTACDLMVFGPAEGDKAGEALAMDEAAREAGLTTRAIRLALDKHHVRQYLNQQKQVFRASASAQNISRLVKLRDTAGNAMAQLGAIKQLEQTDEISERQAAARTPGLVIQIINQVPSEAKSLKTVDVLPNDGSERGET